MGDDRAPGRPCSKSRQSRMRALPSKTRKSLDCSPPSPSCEMESRVAHWTVGQKVAINDGVKGPDGKVRPSEYTLQGPGAAFDTAELAAKDGIAHAFLVQQTLGDNWERGANIDLRADGKYAYRELEVGIPAQKEAVKLQSAVKPGQRPPNIEPGTPFLPNIVKGAAGFFTSIQTTKRSRFRPNDRTAYRKIFDEQRTRQSSAYSFRWQLRYVSSESGLERR
jgi:hypothetical protein